MIVLADKKCFLCFVRGFLGVVVLAHSFQPGLHRLTANRAISTRFILGCKAPIDLGGFSKLNVVFV